MSLYDTFDIFCFESIIPLFFIYEPTPLCYSNIPLFFVSFIPLLFASFIPLLFVSLNTLFFDYFIDKES